MVNPIRVSFFALLLSGAVAAQTPLLSQDHRMLPHTGVFRERGAVADFDGNGTPDLFMPASRSLLLADGNGFFRDASSRVPPSAVPPTWVTARAAAAGDVDGDGDVDLVLANHETSGGGAQNELLLNSSAGFVVATGRLPAVMDNSSDAVLFDVDADGDLDLFVANAPHCPQFGPCVGWQNRLHLNDGNGNFTDATSQLPEVADATAQVAVGDLDNDGDPDLALANSKTGLTGFTTLNHIYVNDGRGRFTTDPSRLSRPAGYGADVVLADFDADGDLDAWFGNAYGQDHLYRNDWPVMTDVTHLLPQVTTGVSSGAAADVDGDGLVDLLVADDDVISGVPNRLFLNAGGMTFVDATSRLTPKATAAWVALLDVDGDQDQDALLCRDLPASNLLLNDGAGGLLDADAGTFLGTPSITPVAGVAAGDVDGDLDQDLVFVRLGSPNPMLFLGQSEGGFVDATSTNLPQSFEASGAHLRDFDDDGDLDLLFGHALYLNDGAGVFTDASAASGFGATRGRPVVGDVDGDGDDDVLFAKWLAQCALFLNDGQARFNEVFDRLPGLQGPIPDSTELADLDGDGDLDLFAGVGGGRDLLYFNDGGGNFTNRSGRLPPVVAGQQSFDAAFGDLDGDRDIDILSAEGGSYFTRYYVNDGTGAFTDGSSRLPQTGVRNNPLLLLDVDGDSDLDLFAGDGALFLNDGRGNFADASSRVALRHETGEEAARADVDGDGDLDVVFGGRSVQQVLHNRTQHVAWRALPRVLKPLDLEISGPPNGAFVLAAAAASTNLPIAGLGTLRLDPSTLLGQVAGSLNGDGVAVFHLPPLAIPAGTTVRWQAVVGLPWRFTNLEVTAFSSY